MCQIIKLIFETVNAKNFKPINGNAIMLGNFQLWCAWVGLKGFFDPTRHGGSKKIQPNPTYYISPTQPTWVRLNP